MLDALSLASLSPGSLKDYIDDRAGDQEQVDFEDSFKEVLHARKTSSTETTTSSSSSSSEEIDPFVEKPPTAMFDRPDLFDAFPGGATSTESVSLTSKRWMTLEVEGDVKALKQALSGKTDQPFSGDFSIRMKYREHFHMLAKQTMQYSLGDLASATDPDEESSSSAVSGMLEMFRDQFDPEDKLDRMKSTVDELLSIGADGGEGDGAVDDSKLRWLTEGAFQQGLWMARSSLGDRFGENDRMPVWVDDQFEETGDELSSFVDDVMSDINGDGTTGNEPSGDAPTDQQTEV